MDPFAVLGISSQSTESEVKKTYKRLALKYHPDKAGKQATAYFQEINGAYETIIAKRLYLDPDEPTKKAGRHASDASSSGVDSNDRPNSQRRPSRPSHQPPSQSGDRAQPPRPTAPPPSPPRPKKQPPPPQSTKQPSHSRSNTQPASPPQSTKQPPPPSQSTQPSSPSQVSPESQPYCSHTCKRGYFCLGNFVRIQEILASLWYAKLFHRGLYDYPTGWSEAVQSFKEFQDMARRRVDCSRLSTQLGTTMYLLKISLANNQCASFAPLVRGFSFAAMMSRARIRVNDLITERGWHNADKAFLQLEEAYERALVSNIVARMPLKEEVSRSVYHRVWLTLSTFLERSKRKNLYLRNPREAVYTKHKVPVALRRLKLSYDAGVPSYLLSIDVGMIMLTWRKIYGDRLGFLYSFDDLARLSGLEEFVDAREMFWMRATFDTYVNIKRHPFSDMWIPPKWAIIARASHSRA